MSAADIHLCLTSEDLYNSYLWIGWIVLATLARLALIFSLLYQMFYERRGAVGEGVNEGVNALVELIKQRQGMRVPALAELMNTSPKNLERWLKQ